MALANQRFQVKLYPTALATDVLFYEVADEVLPKNKFPTYGTPHPNTVDWPNHKLVYITNRREDGKQIWFYAADRANQDSYNWAVTKADIGGTKFDSVVRTYVTPRSSFSAVTPAMGASMSSVPAGMSGTFVLAERRQTKIGEQELDSLYVFDTHVYIDKQPLVDIEINRETGDAQQITTRYFYRGEIVTGSTTIESLVAQPTNAYWDLDAGGFGNVAKQLSDDWWEVTQRQWINLEDVWEWELDRLGPNKFFCPSDITTVTETTTNNSPGPLTPLPSVVVGQRVRITKWGGYMRVTTSTRNESAPRLVDELNYLPDDGFAYPLQSELVENDAVPDERQSIGEDGRIEEYEAIEGCLSVKVNRQALSLEEESRQLSDRLPPDKFYVGGGNPVTEIETVASGTAATVSGNPLGVRAAVTRKGSIQKVETTEISGAPVALPITTVDERTGVGYLGYQELVEIGDAEETEVDADGNLTVYQPYNADYAIKVSRNVVSPETKEWVDIINYEWPPVLTSIYVKVFERRDGGTIQVPVYKFKQGYSGPQQAFATQYWQKDPVTPTSPIQMIAEGISYQNMKWGINIPPCLHPEVTLGINTGTVDPIWKFITDTDTFPATNYTDWPESITWVESKPYQGGYLITEWIVNSPATTPPP